MKRKSSMGLEKLGKHPRQLNALQRNNELSNYLDTLVPGTAPEQQISFARLEEMGLNSAGTIDIDNDYSDDIDEYEREEAEKANAEVMEHIDAYSRDMMKHLRSIRGGNSSSSSSKNVKQAPPPTTPKATLKWNPFRTPVPPLSVEEERQIESCNLFVTLNLYKSIWKNTPFDSVNHFRNVAKQAFNVDHHASDTIQLGSSARAAVVSWSMTDDELLASPIEYLYFVAQLVQDPNDNKWKVTNLWLVPDTITISAV